MGFGRAKFSGPLNTIRSMNFRIIFGWLILGTLAIAHAQTSMDSLTRMPSQPVETRWFTFENPNGEKGKGGMEAFGRKGAPYTQVKKGKTLTLVDIQGSGTIRRMWLTLDGTTGPELLCGLKLESFLGYGASDAGYCESAGGFLLPPERAYGDVRKCIALLHPEGRSFECFIPMPFRKSAKIVLVNESGANTVVYYDIAATLNEKHDDDTLYFHSYWRRENFNKLREDVTILPKVEGRGRFLGCNIGLRENPATTDYWWGEGEVKVYLDGDTNFPTLCGTGTEDYIGDGYGQDRFAHRFTGCQYVNHAGNRLRFLSLPHSRSALFPEGYPRHHPGNGRAALSGNAQGKRWRKTLLSNSCAPGKPDQYFHQEGTGKIPGARSRQNRTHRRLPHPRLLVHGQTRKRPGAYRARGGTVEGYSGGARHVHGENSRLRAQSILSAAKEFSCFGGLSGSGAWGFNHASAAMKCYKSRDFPSISGGMGRLRSWSAVGATSANRPPSRSFFPLLASSTTISSTS